MENICPNCFETGYKDRCELCAYVNIAYDNNHMLLLPGMMLKDRYIVGRVLGAGGFGVTYLVKDKLNGARMAAKEYLPSAFAVRNGASKEVYPSSVDNTDVFKHGLKVFDREAESLRLFLGYPSIVQVTDSFRQNGTSYYIMEFLDGVNLKALARSMNGRLPAEMALEVLQNIGSTLAAVHERGLLHRDVSPENIFVTRQGGIKLIDFGATRFFVGERSRSLSVVLKPGFAPPEQYSSKGNQGPWTDIYALGATFLCVMSGRSLPDAPDRLSGVTLDAIWAQAGLAANLRQAIEKSLALNYRERYQSVGEFLAAVSSGSPSKNIAPQAAPREQAVIRGAPYVRLTRNGTLGDKWVIPAGMDMVIGRSADRCNIILEDPDVSRVHCTIRYDSKTGMFLLTDVSSNGTYLQNGSRLNRNVPHTIAPGEKFVMPGGKYEWEAGVE